MTPSLTPSLPLALRCRPAPVRPVVAWLLPGDSPARWLDSIVASGLPQRTLLVLPVPCHSGDARPLGALVFDGGASDAGPLLTGPLSTRRASELQRPSTAQVVVGRSDPAGTEPAGTKPAGTMPAGTMPGAMSAAERGWLPYGRVGERLFVPVEAELAPAIGDDELAGLLLGRGWQVWHPAAGLFAFEPEETLDVAALVAAGAPVERAWDLAQPGIRLPRRLVSLKPAIVIPPEQWLAEGGDDIGKLADQPQELPERPGEPSGGLGARAARRTRQWLAKWARRIAGEQRPRRQAEQTPREQGSSGARSAGKRDLAGHSWRDRLRAWADNQLRRTSSQLDELRQQHLHRLLHLLESDPDRGLRHAPPLHGGPHRGLAPPSAGFQDRDVDFRLGDLARGGAAADPWTVSSDFHLRLVQTYRELANRELRLGRHRRAAYIFASLLADYTAAASALRQGGHHREAATLYRERLSQPLEAARCLEEAGLLSEAIELYEELGHHEQAGDLHARLGQGEEAERCYRRALEALRVNGDSLSAARLLREKLQRLDEAFAELAGAWPQGRQASECLRREFAWHTELSRRDALLARLRDVESGYRATPPNLRTDLVEILTDVARRHPDRELRAAVVDPVRRLAARQLPDATEPARRRLVECLVDLVPEDRLLRDDGRRFLDSLARRQAPSRARPVGAVRPELVRTLALGRADMEWLAAERFGKYWWGVAKRQRELHVARWTLPLTESPEFVQVGHAPVSIGGPVLAPRFSQDGSIHLALAGAELDFGDQRLVTPFPDAPEHVLSALRTRYGLLHTVIARGHGLELRTWHGGNLMRVCGFPPPDEIEDDATVPVIMPPLPIASTGLEVLVAEGARLLRFEGSGRASVMLRRVVTRLVAPATDNPWWDDVDDGPITPPGRRVVAASFEEGGELFLDNGQRLFPFGAGLLQPLVTLPGRRHLIAASIARPWTVEFYGFDRERLERVAEFQLSSQPISLTTAPQPGRFMVLLATGQLQEYACPWTPKR